MKQGFLTMLACGNYGRFANALYQRSSILGIARLNNLEPVFGPFQNLDHRDRFGSSEDIDLDKYFVHLIPQPPEGIVWNAEMPIQWGYHKVRLPPGNWNLSGHFQAPKYFQAVMDTVRHYLTMKDEPEMQDACAVHWRAGDYSGSLDNCYHPRLDRRFYEPAMGMFPSEQRFLIFSDDIDGAKQMLGNDLHFDYVEGLDYIQSFRLMKRCKDFIIANSSYSAMAATVADHPQKKVVAPRPWFGPAAQINGDAIYCDDWIVQQWDQKQRQVA